jgi:long-chain acyl-CoA synthetase
MAIGEILKEIFKANWDSIFIIDTIGNREITYGSFFLFVLNCTSVLKDLEIGEDTTVCLHMENSLELVILYFALLALQRAVVPLDPKKGIIEKTEIFAQLNDCYIIYDTPVEGATPNGINIANIAPYIFKQGECTTNELELLDQLDYGLLYLICFTSGSTGTPKGVKHSASNIISSALAFKKRLHLSRKNRFFHNLPMTYMAGILNLIFLPFVCESTIILAQRFDITKIFNFWDTPTRHAANTFWFIPTIVALLLRIGTRGSVNTNDDAPMTAFVGTAPIDAQTKRSFMIKYGIPLYESYGLTETLFVTTESPETLEIGSSAGIPLDGVTIFFGPDSEILVESSWMFYGYLDTETQQYLTDGKFSSGDLGVLEGGRLLKITGRKKHVIIRGGMNISPTRIEEYLSKLKAYAECAVIGIPSEFVDERIVCFYVKNEHSCGTEKERELNIQIVRELGTNWAINEFVEVESIPKNLIGKVDRAKLIQIYKELK